MADSFPFAISFTGSSLPVGFVAIGAIVPFFSGSLPPAFFFFFLFYI